MAEPENQILVFLPKYASLERRVPPGNLNQLRCHRPQFQLPNRLYSNLPARAAGLFLWCRIRESS